MTWFKVDDSFHSHPKAMAAGMAAVGLWTIAGAWSNANLTDGFVPDFMLPRFAPDAQELAHTLVAVGLWRRAKGGHRYHDWGDYQPTRDAVLNERQKWAEKKAKQRAGKRDQQDKPSSEHALSLGDTPGDSPEESSPSRSRTRSRTSPKGEVTPDDSLRSSSPPQGAKRGQRIPDNFAATTEMIDWAKANTPHVGARETDAFVDYWRGVAGAKGVKLDWLATWRNWMRRAEKDQARAPTGRGSARTLLEHNGLRLKPETIANLEGRARFEAMDQQLAIEGTAS